MRKVRKLAGRVLLLVLAAAVAVAAYVYLRPLMQAQKNVTYAAYTVERGDIATEKSFSAGISVALSESHQNTTKATAIREIYVKNGQDVRKGDKLMLLDNGELLKAGQDGTVTEMRFDTTDWLWNNVQLIQISDLTHLKVSLSVDEYDVRNVAAGQKCLVTIVPTGEVYETEISHVDRVSASSGQVASYTASAELTVPDSVLPGMTASVTIASDKVENVLVLDMAALAFDEERQPYVLRRTEQGYERLPVETGLSDGMRVEILSGLSEGETVWAVAGEEAAQNPYTISALYKKLFGETIVIRDMTGSDRGGFPGMSRPDGAMGMPSGMPGGMQKNMSTPSDMDMMPEGKMPEMSGGPSGAAGPEGAGQPPQSRDNERMEAR